jgi:stage III sporulation protein AG
MDLSRWKTDIKEYFGKYKYVLVVLIAGIVLMILPGKDMKTVQIQEDQETEQLTAADIDTELEDILTHISGAGKVKVMVSVAQGERTIYQTDTTYSARENNTDSRSQTILITDSGRNQAGLVHQVNPPTYQGAIVLAQGGDNPVVKLALVDAVSKVTGLGADKISVLKMK